MNKNQNKSSIWAIFALLLMVACQTEDPEELFISNQLDTEQNTVADENEALEQMAITLNEAIKNVEVRKIIKEQALKKYDGQYDVPFDYFMDQPLSNLKSTEIETVKDLLNKSISSLKSAPVSNDKSINESISSLSSKVKNLQIAVPINCENWDVNEQIPVIAILPVDFEYPRDEQIKAFDMNGDVFWLDTKTPPDFPVIVISRSERLDEDGNVMYDATGLMIPKVSRVSSKIKMQEATLQIDSSANKNGLVNVLSDLGVLNKISDPRIARELGFKGRPEGYCDELINFFVKDNLSFQEENLKSTSVNPPSKPTGVEVYNSGVIKGLDVYWVGSDNSSDIIYKIKYKVGSSNTVYDAGVSSNTSFVHHGVTPGLVYKYFVVARNTVTGQESAPSDITTSCWGKPSYREHKGYEAIQGLYFDTDYWNSLESWAQGSDLELQIRIITGAINPVTGEAYTPAQNNIFTGHYKEFPNPTSAKRVNWQIYDEWDVFDDNEAYNILITEDDGWKIGVTELSLTIGGKVGASTEKGFYIEGSQSATVKFEFSRKLTKVFFKNIYWYDTKFFHSNNSDVSQFALRLTHLPNSNSEKCPYIGNFDGANCHIGASPVGAKWTISNNYCKYTKPIGVTTCIPGFWSQTLSGIDCCVIRLPEEVRDDEFLEGPHAFLYNKRHLYVTPGY